MKSIEIGNESQVYQEASLINGTSDTAATADHTVPQSERKIPNAFRLLGDHKALDALRISKKEAEGKGKAIFDTSPHILAMCFEREEDAERVAKSRSRGVKFTVGKRFSPAMDRLLNGTPQEQRIVKMGTALHFSRQEEEAALDALRAGCNKSGLLHGYGDFSALERDVCSTWDETKCKAHAFYRKAYLAYKGVKAKNDALDSEIKEIESDELHKSHELAAVLKALDEGEWGDAGLFAERFGDKYVWDPSEGKDGTFYFWNESHWQGDDTKTRYTDMQKIAELYRSSAETLRDTDENKEKKKELLKRAGALRSSRRCATTFVFLHDKVPFKGEWDDCPGFLPCKNGLLDLKTGALLPLAQEKRRYLRTLCPTDFNPHASTKLVDQFLDDITLGDVELSNFLLRVLGSALLGNPREEKAFIFYSRYGRNGKGTLLQSLEKVVGSQAKTFQSEMLLEQRNPPSSSNASPDLAGLQGVRFAIFSEVNKHRKLDTAKIKNLRGRDTISCRRMYSGVDLQIRPSHTLFLQANVKPQAPADDEAFWKTMILIPCNAEFVDDPKEPHQRRLDPDFKAKLLGEREGFLRRLVEGCRDYQVNGLQIPESVKEGVQKYRTENDGTRSFIEERCVLGREFSTPCGRMQDAIRDYCEELGFEKPSQREIVSVLGGQFEKTRTNARSIWKGIGILPEPGDTK